jgi:hypothetical protein
VTGLGLLVTGTVQFHSLNISYAGIRGRNGKWDKRKQWLRQNPTVGPTQIVRTQELVRVSKTILLNLRTIAIRAVTRKVSTSYLLCANGSAP